PLESARRMRVALQVDGERELGAAGGEGLDEVGVVENGLHARRRGRHLADGAHPAPDVSPLLLLHRGRRNLDGKPDAHLFPDAGRHVDDRLEALRPGLEPDDGRAIVDDRPDGGDDFDHRAGAGAHDRLGIVEVLGELAHLLLRLHELERVGIERLVALVLELQQLDLELLRVGAELRELLARSGVELEEVGLDLREVFPGGLDALAHLLDLDLAEEALLFELLFGLYKLFEGLEPVAAVARAQLERVAPCLESLLGVLRLGFDVAGLLPKVLLLVAEVVVVVASGLVALALELGRRRLSLSQGQGQVALLHAGDDLPGGDHLAGPDEHLEEMARGLGLDVDDSAAAIDEYAVAGDPGRHRAPDAPADHGRQQGAERAKRDPSARARDAHELVELIRRGDLLERFVAEDAGVHLRGIVRHSEDGGGGDVLFSGRREAFGDAIAARMAGGVPPAGADGRTGLEPDHNYNYGPRSSTRCRVRARHGHREALLRLRPRTRHAGARHYGRRRGRDRPRQRPRHRRAAPGLRRGALPVQGGAHGVPAADHRVRRLAEERQ